MSTYLRNKPLGESSNRQPTTRQLRVYRFVESFLKKHGYAPSVREIGAGLDIASPNGVVTHLDALVRKGLLVIDTDVHRRIKLAHTKRRCPNCGCNFFERAPKAAT